MPAFKLILEYDGTRYRGWQEQKNARTVQGELRRVLEDYFGAAVELQGAGRTDAGVHALGQVALLRTASAASSASPQFLRTINDRLPADIAILAMEPAARGFHARHDALARVYAYRLAVAKSAFTKKYCWWVKDAARLDLDAMGRAAAVLPGRHDFVLFRAEDPARPDESTLVQVLRAELTPEPGVIVFRIEASHFLWRMVRRLVGTLVEVGKGTLSADDFALLFKNPAAEPASRTPAATARVWPISEWTAPAAGLFLEQVRYPEASPANRPDDQKRREKASTITRRR